MKKPSYFNVAEYVRLSREDGDKAESDSIGNQRKLIADYLESRCDLFLYDIYIDDGFTGTHFNRPSFQRMIADIEAGKVNCVIVKDLSRFGRDYIDTGKYLERYFPEHEVRFISITDNIDSMNQPYDMLLPIKNIFNEQYARDISQKVHASLKTKQNAGEFIGAFASYGYRKSSSDKNKLVIDEYAAEIVRKIFQLYIAGYGKIRIASLLNEQNIVCPSVYKKLNGEHYRNSSRLESTSYWTYSTINRILQNEMYIGNMVQGRKYQKMRGKPRTLAKEDWIVVKGTHEALITEETFYKAQDLLKRRTRNLDLTANRSIFAGFVKCGDCGRALVKKNAPQAQDKTRITYYCGTYVRSGRHYCTPHPIPCAVLEQILLEDLNVIMQRIANMRECIVQCAKRQKTAASKQRSNRLEKSPLHTELKKVQNLKKAVYEDYQSGLLSKEEFITYRQDYLAKESLLKKQLTVMPTPQKEAVADPFENPWIKHLSEHNTIEKLDRDIVIEMIQEIKVYENNRIKITYNFSDELENLFKTTYTDHPANAEDR